mmetsp:Transcript_22868/g.27495  ORF Transcript_22868/g.27495 Transcript_22868/m.27495 type:complete len:136 (+) Transcript_22868:133-540(+)
MLSAAVAKADEMKVPQCIVIVDVSGEVLGEIRMTNAKFLSLKSALSKARSAASSGKVSNLLPHELRQPLAFATQGAVTGMPGGLPILIEENGITYNLGGIGVGSGTGDDDIQVANAALEIIGAKTFALSEVGGEP